MQSTLFLRRANTHERLQIATEPIRLSFRESTDAKLAGGLVWCEYGVWSDSGIASPPVEDNSGKDGIVSERTKVLPVD